MARFPGTAGSRARPGRPCVPFRRGRSRSTRPRRGKKAVTGVPRWAARCMVPVSGVSSMSREPTTSASRCQSVLPARFSALAPMRAGRSLSTACPALASEGPPSRTILSLFRVPAMVAAMRARSGAGSERRDSRPAKTTPMPLPLGVALGVDRMGRDHVRAVPGPEIHEIHADSAVPGPAHGHGRARWR